MPTELLRAAAVGYCTSQQQAEAPVKWFEEALAYTARRLLGATATLSPVSKGGMRQIACFIPADYLIEHAARERRYERVPASLWDALLHRIDDPVDTVQLAQAPPTASFMAMPFPSTGTPSPMAASSRRTLWPSYCPSEATSMPPKLSSERTRLVAMRKWRPRSALPSWKYSTAAPTDWLTCWPIGATRKASASSPIPVRNTPSALAELLTARDDLDGAVQVLRRHADAGGWGAGRRLADLPADRGDEEGLRELADSGEEHAVGRLADLLTARDDLDGAVQVLRRHADAGGWGAGRRLADLPADRGDEEGLRELADSGEEHAVGRLTSSPHGMTWTERSRYCAATRTPEAGMTVAGWPSYWPSLVT